MHYFTRAICAAASVLLLLSTSPAPAQGVFPPPEAAPDLRLEVSGSVNAILPFEDEGNRYYVIAGAFDRVGADVRHNLALVDANGDLADAGFDADWLAGTSAPVLALALHGGEVIVGGEFTAAGGEMRSRLAKFSLEDGTLDQAFAPSANDVVRALLVDGFGHVYVGGTFTSIGVAARNRSAKLEAASGAVVAGWAPAYPSADVVFALAYDEGAIANDASDDHVYVGGNLRMEAGGPENRALGRLTAASGAIDMGWMPQVRQAGGASVRSIVVDGDFVYAGGILKSIIVNNNRNNIARFARSNAALDAWNPNADGPLSAMALAADGHLVVAGEFTSIGGVAKQRIAKLRRIADVDGAAGSAFAGFTASADRSVAALAVDSTGAVLAGGLFNLIDATVEGGIARLDPATGTPDAGFAATAGGPGVVRAYAFDALGGVVIGGTFDAVRSGNDPAIARRNVARLNPDFSLDASFNADAFGDVLALSIADDKLYLGGRFLQVAGGIGRTRLARFDLDPGTGAATLDATWTPTADLEVRLLVADAGGVHAFGDFTSINATPRLRAARIDAGGTLAAWAPQPDGRVEAFAIDGSGIYLGGSFTNVGGQARANLARVDAGTGAADLTFAFDADGTVGALALEDGRLYVGGAFGTIGGESIRSLARIDLAGAGVDAAWTPWAPTASGYVRALALDPDSDLLYAGGNFPEAGGLVRPNLVRVNGDSVETQWRPGTNAEVRQVSLLADDSLLLAGDFSRVTGEIRTGLARLGDAGSAITEVIELAFDPLGASLGEAYVASFAIRNTSGTDTPSGSVSVSSVGGVPTETNACTQQSLAVDPQDSSRLLGAFACASDRAGTHAVTVEFTGDAQFLDSQASADYEVAQAQSILTVSTDSPSAFGAGVLATLGFSSDPDAGDAATGDLVVEVRDGSDALVDSCTAPVAAATSCLLSNVAFVEVPGLYQVRASYAGDANHAAGESAAIAHEVLGEPVTIEIVAQSSDTTTVNESYDVTVEVSGSGTPTGSVQITDQAGASCSIAEIDFANGDRTCTLDSPSVGTKTLLAQFSGSGTSGNADSSAQDPAVTHEVTAAATSLSVVLSPATAVFGETLTATVDFAADPAGDTVPTGEISVTGCTAPIAIASLVAGQGSCTLAAGAAGVLQTVTANYAGDPNFSGSSDSDDITPAKADTAFSAFSSLTTTAEEGGSITFSWSLGVVAPGQGTPTGNVRVSVDGNGTAPSCTVAVGAGTCNIVFPAEGSFSMRAEYLGDDNFNPSLSTGSVDVIIANAAPIQADLQISKTVSRSRLDLANQIEIVEYLIVVANAGPGDVVNAVVADVLPDALDAAVWTCEATDAGASCGAAGGSGDISVQVTLPANTAATFILQADVVDAPFPGVLNTATVEAPNEIIDPDLANNTSSVLYQACIGNTGSQLSEHFCTFSDGFEGPPSP
jgi:uncharacterized repeat protein (TIGR01451 family)